MASPTTPSTSAPGAFPEPDVTMANGVNGHEEKSPTPPPHQAPAAQTTPPEPVDPEACKVAGNKFFKAKDYARAIVEYTKAVDSQPSNATYLSNRAAAYISNNQYKSALADSLEANALDPANDKIIHRLARIYTALGEPEKALEQYAQLKGGASAKDTAPARYALQTLRNAEALISSENGSGETALWNLDQARSSLGSSVTEPRRWQILRAKAHLKIQSASSLAEVQNIARSLTRDDPMDAEAVFLAGKSFYYRGEGGPKPDSKRAEDCFREALRIDPDISQALKQLRLMQRLEKAKEAANASFKAGRYSQAVDQYTEALLVDPLHKSTNAKLLNNRAMSRMKLKDYTLAIADCDEAIKFDPSFTKARRIRAKAVGESGNWEQAVKDLKELAEENPTETDLQKEVRNAEMELKKSKRKDYYKILGVEKDANEYEIKKAYKKQALIYHPDKNPGDAVAEDKFKDLQEANETLSDPQKRQRYDSGVDLMDPADAFGGGMNGFGGGGVQIDPSMIFNMMNGGGGGGGGGFGGMPQFHYSHGGGGRPGGFPF